MINVIKQRNYALQMTDSAFYLSINGNLSIICLSINNNVRVVFTFFPVDCFMIIFCIHFTIVAEI